MPYWYKPVDKAISWPQPWGEREPNTETPRMCHECFQSKYVMLDGQQKLRSPNQSDCELNVVSEFRIWDGTCQKKRHRISHSVGSGFVLAWCIDRAIGKLEDGRAIYNYQTHWRVQIHWLRIGKVLHLSETRYYRCWGLGRRWYALATTGRDEFIVPFSRRRKSDEVGVSVAFTLSIDCFNKATLTRIWSGETSFWSVVCNVINYSNRYPDSIAYRSRSQNSKDWSMHRSAADERYQIRLPR